MTVRLGMALLLWCAAGVAWGAGDARPPLAVGAALDAGQRIWLARVAVEHLWVSHSADGGAHFSMPIAVTREPEAILAEGESRPKIAVDADGTVLVAWTQALPQRFSGHIRFARSTDGGQTFSAPITLNEDRNPTSHRFESLASDGKGRVLVAWLDARDRDAAKARGEHFAGASLYAAQSADHGASFGANRRLAAHTCECCRTATAWSPGGPVLLWRNLYDGHTRDFALMDVDRGTARRVSEDEWRIDACPHHGGGVAVDARGASHVVWFTEGAARQGLFYKRLVGAEASPPLAFGNRDAQAGHAGVAASGNLVVIAWREFDGTTYAVLAMRSDDGGTTWRAPQRLAQTAGAADYPLALTDGQRAWVVWNTAEDALRVLPVVPGSAPEGVK